MHNTYLCISVKKDETGRVDRTQWKSMANTMADVTKFVDMLHNVPWEDGLPEDVLRGKRGRSCSFTLTLSQTINFRLFQTERVCR